MSCRVFFFLFISPPTNNKPYGQIHQGVTISPIGNPGFLTLLFISQNGEKSAWWDLVSHLRSASAGEVWFQHTLSMCDFESQSRSTGPKVSLWVSLEDLMTLHFWSMLTYPPSSSHVWASLNSFRSGEAELEKTKTCKWGLMWHSIIASTSDRTYLPYYRFLRVLDVGELEDYLIKIDFRGDKE